MIKIGPLSALALAAGLLALAAAAIAAESNEPPASAVTLSSPPYSIRKLDEQVVLYMIYRGSYDRISPVIGKLFALAGEKAIQPQGPVTFAYLNSPKRIGPEHWLTEIRIPVSKDALKLAGTLGEFTDVKLIAPMEVAVAVKSEGQADPSLIYEGLQLWLLRQGYIGNDVPFETFLTNAESGDYAKMKVEITMPIAKISTVKTPIPPITR